MSDAGLGSSAPGRERPRAQGSPGASAACRHGAVKKRSSTTECTEEYMICASQKESNYTAKKSDKVDPLPAASEWLVSHAVGAQTAHIFCLPAAGNKDSLMVKPTTPKNKTF